MYQPTGGTFFNDPSKESTCPNCGYCKHCGRSTPVYSYQWSYPSVMPATPGTYIWNSDPVTGTWSVTEDSTNG